MEQIEDLAAIEGRKLEDTSKALKNLAASQKARDEMINDLKEIQDKTEFLSMAGVASIDTHYAIIMLGLSNALDKKNGTLDEGMLDKINQTIKYGKI